jgi:hypothetical protein
MVGLEKLHFVHDKIHVCEVSWNLGGQSYVSGSQSSYFAHSGVDLSRLG